jgi:hypothetical protein
VSLHNLKGEALANAIMKCETKAKRRVTLSICGLGLLDELDVETLPTVVSDVAQPVAQIAPSAPENFDAWLADLEAVAVEGTDALTGAWKESPNHLRAYLTKTDPTKWKAIKARAEAKDAEVVQ